MKSRQNDKSSNQQWHNSYDTGEFRFFTFGKGYMPPETKVGVQMEEAKCHETKKILENKSLMTFSGVNGIGYIFKELTAEEELEHRYLKPIKHYID